MSLRRYATMFDSGYVWLSDIPSHWSLRRIGQVFQQRSEKVSDRDFPPLSVTKNGILPQLDHVAKTDDNDNRKLVRAGDFVINSRSDRKGSAGIAEQDGSISLINTVLVPDQSLDHRYCHHLFRCTAFQEEFYRMGSGLVADLWSTNFSTMKGIMCALPPIDEQTAIGTFLDREIARIDVLIKTKERFIGLLKEKRAALITHAVTNGLDPLVPMKSSGVGWLKAIPAHWQIAPPHVIFHESKERAHDGDQLLSATQKYGVIPLADFESLEQRQVTKAVANLEMRKHVEIGDFVISMRSMDGGLERAFATGSVRSSYSVVKPGPRVDGRFYVFLLKCDMYIQALKLTSNFIRDGQDMNFGHFRKVPLPVPPIEEQALIADHIEAETARIAQLTIHTQRSIELLKERRAALITAAVTGKIDVRVKA